MAHIYDENLESLGEQPDLGPEEQAYGIAETLDVIRFLARSASLAAASGGMGMPAILAEFLKFVPDAVRAVSGIGDVPEEISDLDDGERALIASQFAADFDLANDRLELLVEEAWAALTHFLRMYSIFAEARPPRVPVTPA